MKHNSPDGILVSLKNALRAEAQKHDLIDAEVSIRCRPLASEEAIGNPEDRDYPLIKGKERMIEANFRGARGNAFSDEYGNADYSISELLDMELDSNRKRADFVATFNAVYRHLGLCEHTVHCRDFEPRECAQELLRTIPAGKKVLLVGLQPRFLEYLSGQNEVRVIDLDPDNIGTKKFGVMVEPPGKTEEAIGWCDLIFATGSTLVNCTITDFLDTGKPVIFYGVTISAPAKVIGLDTYCPKGR